MAKSAAQKKKEAEAKAQAEADAKADAESNPQAELEEDSVEQSDEERQAEQEDLDNQEKASPRAYKPRHLTPSSVGVDQEAAYEERENERSAARDEHNRRTGGGEHPLRSS